MAVMLSAKGSDLRNWRAAGEFALSSRGALLDRTAFCTAEEALELYGGSIAELERLAVEHAAALDRLRCILAELDGGVSVPGLRELLAEYYAVLYGQAGRFRSAPLFYNLSMALLGRLAGALTAAASDRLGLFARRMPAWSLVALGPAGRGEFSPFCPLQLLLVHDDAGPSERETLSLFGRMLHEGFEEAGVRIDPVITPRNPSWHGSVSDWRRKLESGLEQGDVEELIELLRLADQQTICAAPGADATFRHLCLGALRSSRPALANLAERMSALSNGLGLLGKLKLEKSGPERGLFGLLDHGLLPLSAAISVLALLRGGDEAGTPARVRELLARRELNVDMAERMLQTWHALHELRLEREQGFSLDVAAAEVLCLDPEQLDGERQAELHQALEAVAAIQRYVYVIYNEAGE